MIAGLLRTAVPAAVVAGLALMPAAAQALPPEGGLAQLAPPNNCIQEGAGGCGVTTAVGLNTPQDVVVSPDGKNAYATAFLDDSVAAFSVNTGGGLEQLGDPNECISDDADGAGANPPTDPSCQSGVGLDEALGIAISPDGLTVYVVSRNDSAIAVFSRDPATGVLTQLADPNECLSDDPDGPGVTPPVDPGCASGIGLTNATDIAVSPDGANVYVASFSSTVASFARDTTAAGAPLGSLAQLPGADACITQVGFGTSCTVNGGQNAGHGIISPTGIDVSDDGDNAYVVGPNGDSLAVFTRNPDGSIDQLGDPNDCLSDDPDGAGGGMPTDTNCVGAFGLNGASGVDVAPDGDAVYAASAFSDSVAELQRDGSTGALTQLTDPDECLSFDSDFEGPNAPNGVNNPTDANCAGASGLNGANSVIVAPDNKSVYVGASSVGLGDLAAFSRNQSTEGLNQLNDPDDCLGSLVTNCAAATNLFGARAVAIAPNNTRVYAAAQGAGLAAFSRELGPTCSGAAVSVPHNTPTPIALNCTDPNADPLDRSILVQPGHGTLSGDPDTGTVTYTPVSGYTGPDSFIFNAEDLPPPSQVSGIATVSLTVAAPDRSVVLELSAKRKQKAKKGRVRVSTRCPAEACNVVATGNSLKPATASLQAGVSAPLKLKLKKKALDTLEDGGTVRTTVAVTATDAAGNQATRAVKVKLKRSR